MYAGMQWEENSGIYSVYRLQWTGKARQWQQSVWLCLRAATE